MIETTRVLAEIQHERRKQIRVKGYTREYDDMHVNEELADAAGAILLNMQDAWPFDTQSWKDYENQGNYRKGLIVAAAFVVAEIERIDRTALEDKREE